MEAFHLVSLALSVQGRIDASWAFFLSLNSSIIAGVILIKRTFNIFEKSIAILIYLVVAGLNYLVVINSINLLGSIYSDLGQVNIDSGDPGFLMIQQMNHVFESSILWSNPQTIPLIYLSAAIMIILAVIFDERFTQTDVELDPGNL